MATVRRAMLRWCASLLVVALLGPTVSMPAAAAQTREHGRGRIRLPSVQDTPSADVQVTLDLPALATGQSIGATVLNGGDAAIYAFDEQTDCSILTVLRWDGAAWQPVRGCGLRRLPRAVPVAAGESVDVTINAYSAFLGGSQQAGVPAFPVGWYCLELDYDLGPPEAGGPASVAYSDPFYIAAFGD